MESQSCCCCLLKPPREKEECEREGIGEEKGTGRKRMPSSIHALARLRILNATPTALQLFFDDLFIAWRLVSSKKAVVGRPVDRQLKKVDSCVGRLLDRHLCCSCLHHTDASLTKTEGAPLKEKRKKNPQPEHESLSRCIAPFFPPLSSWLGLSFLSFSLPNTKVVEGSA